MISYSSKLMKFLTLVFIFIMCGSMYIFAAESDKEYITNDRVNFRVAASMDADIIKTLNPGTSVMVSSYISDGWSVVSYNGAKGFIKSEYITDKEIYESSVKSDVELLEWTAAKEIFTIGVTAEIYDVRTGLIYYVKSFSNGRHADVEPVTKEDTAIMLKTYNGKWEWDPRPVFVTINNKTMAASINGMPHGGGVNSDNGMDGQVCLHFKGSTTHNGNRTFEKDHQNAVIEAWNKR